MAPEKGECRNEDFTVLGEDFTDARQLAIRAWESNRDLQASDAWVPYTAGTIRRAKQGTIPPKAV